MINRLQTSLKEKDKGFTLVELLVVVVIIGILAGIAIPLFLSQKQKAVESGIKSDLKNSATVQETYFIDNNTYAIEAAFQDLDEARSTGANVISVDSATALAYCIDGTNTDYPDVEFHFNSADGIIAEGLCTPAGP